jgi:methylated-DNA-[protein]-cysteine S-methyltransferase
MRISKQTLSGNLIRAEYRSPVGVLYLVASSVGLRAVLMEKDMEDEQCRNLVNNIGTGKSEIISRSISQLKDYFRGRRTDFSLPLEFIGTDFQKKVWQSLRKIKYGETKSYSWQAKTINHPRSVRAVGTANGRNPIGIIIPCHRVIRKDKALAGYGGGLEVKRKLLDIER